MSLPAIEYIRHIKIELDYLLERTEGMTWEEFDANWDLKRAFARSFEIIGEASKQVPQNITENYPDIAWSAMAKMRDRLIHHYFGTNYKVLWDTIKNVLPEQKQKIDSLLEELK
jgi:uncharacterized protein with HEPN domain